MTEIPVTFASVAHSVHENCWRPFPGYQADKAPAMQAWSELNFCEWDEASLLGTILEYQPPGNYCCCFAVQREIVAVDIDIVDPEHAAYASNLADNIFGQNSSDTNWLRTEVHPGLS